MIHISSSGLPAPRITDTIDRLAAAGFRGIELSGGSTHYPGLEQDLLDHAGAGLDLQLHNYFPPPVEPFVLNLASLDDGIHARSLAHCRRALALSNRLGARRYGVHAGFLLDPAPRELGQALADRPFADRDRALERFVSSLAELATEAGATRLYIENNVLSARNRRTWPGPNPLLLCCAADWRELRPLLEPLGIGLLLDLAHLRVSAHSLGLDFAAEADELLCASDYLHLSDNNGLEDSNGPLCADGEILASLSRLGSPPAALTLEVYTGLDHIRESARLLDGLWPGLLEG